MNTNRWSLSAILSFAAVIGAVQFGASVQSPDEMATKRTKTLNNVKQIATGLMIYSTDYDDYLPYAQSVTAVQYLTYPYIKNLDVWKTYNPNGGKIAYNTSIGGASVTQIEAPADTVMVYETMTWPDGRRTVAKADTSARVVDANLWKELSKTLKLKLPKKGKPLPANYGVDWAKKNGLLK